MQGFRQKEGVDYTEFFATVCHHFVREKVRHKLIELEHIRTEHQPADGLSKALEKPEFVKSQDKMGAKPTFEPHVEENSRGRHESGGSSFTAHSFLTLSLLMFLVCCFPGCDAGGNTNPSAVLCRKSGLPVASGFNNINMMVTLISPCDLIQTNKTDKPISIAKSKCAQVYKELFLDEIGAMCPPRGWSSLATKKTRFVFTLFVVCVLAVVASAGIGVAGYTTAMVNKQEVSNLKSAHDIMERELKLL